MSDGDVSCDMSLHGRCSFCLPPFPFKVLLLSWLAPGLSEVDCSYLDQRWMRELKRIIPFIPFLL